MHKNTYIIFIAVIVFLIGWGAYSKTLNVEQSQDITGTATSPLPSAQPLVSVSVVNPSILEDEESEGIFVMQGKIKSYSYPKCDCPPGAQCEPCEMPNVTVIFPTFPGKEISAYPRLNKTPEIGKEYKLTFQKYRMAGLVLIDFE